MAVSVLVTGAHGNVGREVVRALLARGVSVVAGDHREGRLSTLFAKSVGKVRLAFRDPNSWEPALQGARHLFLVRPPAIADVERTLNPFVDVATRCGVEHIVFLSVAGAGHNRWVPHRKVEDHLRARGPHHTNLRPGFFAQNLAWAYGEDIRADDRIYVPAGHAPVNWIDVRDIAEVAALVFTEPASHRGENYTLTGPGPVPWSEVTEALSAALGRPIRYQAASTLGYVRHLARRKAPLGAIVVQTLLHLGLRFGHGAAVDPTLERLLGRKGRPVRAYVDDHHATWLKSESPGTTAGTPA